YQDSVGSHGALADQYAADDFHADLKWLLEHKRVAVASDVHETGIVGNQVIMAPGPDDARSVVDIGFDANENGNLHGWITTPIGGVDVTIGKQGLDVGAGVAVIGSAGVSISDDGWMVRVNAGNGASGG